MLVAKPWDFESADGRGRLRGQVSKIHDFRPEGGQELVLIIAPTVLCDVEVTTLRALAIHAAQENLIQQLECGRTTGVRLYGPGAEPPLLIGSIRRLGRLT